jgi:stalled ribosome alternative rescue factor ArfA
MQVIRGSPIHEMYIRKHYGVGMVTNVPSRQRLPSERRGKGRYGRQQGEKSQNFHDETDGFDRFRRHTSRL